MGIGAAIPGAAAGRTAAAAVLLVAVASGCARERCDLKGTDPLGLDDAARRLLYLQIVEDEEKPDETAAIESRTFHYFLRLAAISTEPGLNRVRTSRAVWERLISEPDSCRGHAVGVVGALVEVRWADPPPGLGLEEYEVLKGGLISSKGEFYELRLLVRKDDPEIAKLRDERVVRVSARFFKTHAVRTSRPGAGALLLPMLVGPKPLDRGRDYPVYAELARRGDGDLFPIEKWPAPKTPYRTVLEIRPDRSKAVDGRPVPPEELDGALKAAFEAQKRDGADEPAAVVAAARGLKWAEVTELIPEAVSRLKAAGFRRIHVKDESVWQDP
ncbi:MAG: hypothetical protein N3A38_07295 [Planctomycetota bacterium]|nr:hypothetical protein [Planctomycetota bacterium]